MDITAINFDEKLPYLESSIEDAIFVAVDTEFTGLSIEDQKISSLDTLEERYEKIRNAKEICAIAQSYGILRVYIHSTRKAAQSWRPAQVITHTYFFVIG